MTLETKPEAGEIRETREHFGFLKNDKVAINRSGP